MGICALQHRQVTGYFNAGVIIKCIAGRSHRYDQGMSLIELFSAIIGVSGVLLYSYIICCIFSLYVKVISRSDYVTCSTFRSLHNTSMNSIFMPLLSREAMNILFLALIMCLVKTAIDIIVLMRI